MSDRILICDDEDGIRRYLEKMLARWDYSPQCFASPTRLIHSLKEDAEAALVLLDVKMPEMDGVEALKQIRRHRPELPVIMMTGHGTIELAVEAMKEGAYDFLSKPFPQEKLFALLRHCLEGEKLRRENSELKKELKDQQGQASKLVFASPRFRAVYDLALRVAKSDASVLITGESGTGKELVAGTIHHESLRAKNRFLAINCAALSETLLESQLFGHARGAFTGAVQAQKGLLEEADGGTLFLDEVGDLSPSLQAKLLRALQEGEFLPVGVTRVRKVNVRFVAATNKDLSAEVAAGRFREDLFYRLNVIAIELPPLRERPEDIKPLALHFLDRTAAKTGRPAARLSSEALELLQGHPWPGNVRELENAMERGAILTLDDTIGPELLPFSTAPADRAGSRTEQATTPAPEGVLTLKDAECIQVRRALAKTGWNKSQAAILLGVTRKTLDRKIKEFALLPGDDAP